MCVPHIRFWQAETNMRSTHILRKYAAHANVLTYFTFELTYVVTTYLFKYFKYAKGLLTHMRTSYIHRGLPCEDEARIYPLEIAVISIGSRLIQVIQLRNIPQHTHRKNAELD